MVWHHPIGGEVSGYNLYPLPTRTTAFIPDIQVVNGDKGVKSHPLSHQLCLGPWLEQPGYVVHFCVDKAQGGEHYQKNSMCEVVCVRRE